MIGIDGKQVGVVSLADAINMARSNGVDLVEIAPNATPPVCRLVDYGKFRYEQSKKDKESRKHQHANKVKEVQLSPSIDPHDLSVKLSHALDFLCEEMKVKVSLRFRGREMAHQEFGFQVVNKFIKDLAAYGQPDAPPKLIGRGIHLMLSPLPRNKRAKHPRELEDGSTGLADQGTAESASAGFEASKGDSAGPREKPSSESNSGGFNNNPFNQLEIGG